MIDLTLNGFLRPALIGIQPQFGTVIEPDTQNKGGLSTAQTDNNVAMPFSLMRPITVGNSDSTSNIEFDAKLLITGDIPITLTLGEAVYEGCSIIIINKSTQTVTITSTKIEGVRSGEIYLDGNSVLEMNYTESDGWIYSNADVGSIKIWTGDTLPLGWLWCDGTEYYVTQYPRLSKIMLKLPFNQDVTEGMFKVIDMREAVPVGSGENISYAIADHDVYALGEFKDDQLQDHTHSPNGLTGGRIHNGRRSGDAETEDGINVRNTGKIASGYRKGTTTHGKQIGVNFIIKY